LAPFGGGIGSRDQPQTYHDNVSRKMKGEEQNERDFYGSLKPVVF